MTNFYPLIFIINVVILLCDFFAYQSNINDIEFYFLNKIYIQHQNQLHSVKSLLYQVHASLF